VRRTEAMLDDVFAGLTPGETVALRDVAQRWLAALADAPSREE